MCDCYILTGDCEGPDYEDLHNQEEDGQDLQEEHGEWLDACYVIASH